MILVKEVHNEKPSESVSSEIAELLDNIEDRSDMPLRKMTVLELITELSRLPPIAEVTFKDSFIEVREVRITSIANTYR